MTLLCDFRAVASLLCPWKTDKRTNLMERSGEATGQGEHSQFGHVRGDITGEQRQVVADALDWSQIMNSEFTGDICHQFNQVTPRIIPGDLSASHKTAAAEARTEARFSRS